ncbi:hypothetical protein CLOP_g24135 [Closterium sp. NIES-67]|nr:hypothetical protein CLOP_g24135 [Closterium sp. NIES-67]
MRKDQQSKGLTDRKIGLAITLGAALGTLLAVWQFSQGALTPEERELRGVREEVLSLQRRLHQLKSEKADLDKKLLAASGAGDEGAGGAAATAADAVPTAESLWSGVRIKAGPRGTVHSQSKNPEIIPDPTANPQLAALLEKVAINREIIVGISNINIRSMLETWFTQIQRAGIKNYLVVALDDMTKELCESRGVPVYQQEAKIADTQKDGGDNHAISSSKFHLLRDFLVLGYSVLLSDIDIGFLQNPFEGNHLYRDSDVEGMTDGFTNATAYGYDDVLDDPALGWGRYAHSMRIFVFNSGLFYIRPTAASIELLDRVAMRLAREKAWDQAVYNEEMWFPSRPGVAGLHISRRAMDYFKFMNSKVLFKQVRKEPGRFAGFTPVSVHVNYHPEKEARLVALIDYYVNGNKGALDPFPDGSIS